MCPVHEFRDNFDQTDPSNNDQSEGRTDDLSFHEADSTVRNLCLVWADGRKTFFNYAYLMAGDLTVQDDLNLLLLSFGSYTVLLKGYRLATLFEALLEHTPRIITATHSRYLAQSDPQAGVVIEIIVKSE